MDSFYNGDLYFLVVITVNLTTLMALISSVVIQLQIFSQQRTLSLVTSRSHDI